MRFLKKRSAAKQTIKDKTQAVSAITITTCIQSSRDYPWNPWKKQYSNENVGQNTSYQHSKTKYIFLPTAQKHHLINNRLERKGILNARKESYLVHGRPWDAKELYWRDKDPNDSVISVRR